MNAYMTIGQHEETGLYHGLVYKNHPTPSGCDRWLLSLSTKEGFKTEREAGEYMNTRFPHFLPIDLNPLDKIDYFATMPSIPAGSEITLMDFNPSSFDPAPIEQFPLIEVRFNGVKQNVNLSLEHLNLLKKQNKIEVDSFNDDPNLSCTYIHYFVKSIESSARG